MEDLEAEAARLLDDLELEAEAEAARLLEEREEGGGLRLGVALGVSPAGFWY